MIPVFREYTGADLVIAGDGEYSATLKRIANGNPRIRFLGRIAPEQLDLYYRHAIALVLARRIGPFPEIVSRSGGGLLFDGPADLVDAMQQIQSDPELREHMANQGRAAFLKYWSEAAVIPRFLEVVRRTADRTRRTDILTKLEATGHD